MTRRIYESLLPLIADLLFRAGEKKNVALGPEECVVAARSILGDFHSKELQWLARGEPNALELAANAIDRTLDIIAAGRAFRVIAHLQGDESPDGDVIMAKARAAAGRFAANDATGAMFRWPDLVEIVAMLMAPRPTLAMSPCRRVRMTVATAMRPPLIGAGESFEQALPAQAAGLPVNDAAPLAGEAP